MGRFFGARIRRHVSLHGKEQLFVNTNQEIVVYKFSFHIIKLRRQKNCNLPQQGRCDDLLLGRHRIPSGWFWFSCSYTIVGIGQHPQTHRRPILHSATNSLLLIEQKWTQLFVINQSKMYHLLRIQFSVFEHNKWIDLLLNGPSFVH